MTWWVINCPGAAQSPVPGSLFLLYDKKERRSSEAVCINNKRRISSLLRKILLSHSFQAAWRGPSHSLNSHLFPEPSDVIFANSSSRELGTFWRWLPSHPPPSRGARHHNFALSGAWPSRRSLRRQLWALRIRGSREACKFGLNEHYEQRQ